MEAAKKLSGLQNEQLATTLGPCWPFVEALEQLAERLRLPGREYVGWLANGIPRGAREAALSLARQAAAAAGRLPIGGTSISPWENAAMRVQDARHRSLTLKESLQETALAYTGDQALFELAQVVTVWDRHRQPAHEALFNGLALMGRHPDLIQDRLPIIVGVQAIRRARERTCDWMDGLALLRLYDDEPNDKGDARQQAIAAVDQAYAANQASSK